MLQRTVRSDRREDSSERYTERNDGILSCEQFAMRCWKSHITMPARAIRSLLRQILSLDWTVSFAQRETGHSWIERMILHRLYNLTWFAYITLIGFALVCSGLAMLAWQHLRTCSHPRATVEQTLGPYTEMQQGVFHWLPVLLQDRELNTSFPLTGDELLKTISHN